MTGCIPCENTARIGSLPVSEEIVVDDHWRVAHAFGCSLPGWLVVIPRRHVISLDELTEREMLNLGPLLANLTRALREVVGCPKTYVALFTEAAGFEHVHIHVIPRMHSFTDLQKGPAVFPSFLGVGPDAQVPLAERDRIAADLQAALR